MVNERWDQMRWDKMKWEMMIFYHISSYSCHLPSHYFILVLFPGENVREMIELIYYHAGTPFKWDDEMVDDHSWWDGEMVDG